LLPGTDNLVVETALGFSLFVTLQVHSKGTVVDDEIVIVAFHFAFGLLVGALFVVVEATRGFPLVPASIVKSVGAVVGSNYCFVVFVDITERLLAGAFFVVIKATRGFSLVPASIVKSVGAVVGSHHAAASFKDLTGDKGVCRGQQEGDSDDGSRHHDDLVVDLFVSFRFVPWIETMLQKVGATTLE
jgi:hypothetical protein